MMMSTPTNDLLLRAARGERTERTPVWLMRQAGRFDPKYREIRRRCGLELEELFRDPELAAEITMLPVRFGVDGAILFQDILTPLAPMGAPVVFRPGPILTKPIRGAGD
ncbi:MAG: uroporphyrinogen decarboxylase family protein, partial [Myxococcota bacterium]